MILWTGNGLSRNDLGLGVGKTKIFQKKIQRFFFSFNFFPFPLFLPPPFSSLLLPPLSFASLPSLSLLFL